MHIMKLAFIAVPLLLVSACGDVDSTPAPLTDKQASLLTRELDGKVAGAPINCISNFRADNMIRVSDNIVLFRVSGRLVYKNTLRFSCPGLARDSDIVVIEQFGGQKCRGDLLRLVDRTSGIAGPVCSLGAFVPYRKDSAQP